MKKIFTYALVMIMSMMAMTSLTSCQSNDQYEADLLIDGDWQGYLGEYYYDRWGLSGKEYETTMRFASRGVGATSGRGYEVDYNVNTFWVDYAYCEFSWSIVDGVITLIYDDALWAPVYISQYSLTSRYFSGYMNDGTRRDIRFELENVRFDYWDNYRYDRWDDYYDYWARTRSAVEGDTTTTATPALYKNNGKSILSGVFAK